MAQGNNIYDLIIIGAGPAGLSAADTAQQEGLNYLVIEKGLLAQTIYEYPVGRTVFSTPNELEFREGDLKPCREKPTREELLSYYVKFTIERSLRINSEETVIELKPGESDFQLHTDRGEYTALSVLVAVGAMARRRRLEVAGEELPKVHHRFTEPYPFVKKHAMVIGGGNSAAEAALFLAEEGAYTTLAILLADWENKDPKKGAIKHWVRDPLEDLIRCDKLRLLPLQQVTAIYEDTVSLIDSSGNALTLPNDVAFVLIGADADLSLLKQAGVETRLVGLAEVPVYDPETFETNVPGIFVAGHFTLARHIKEAIAVPRRIVPIIAERLRSSMLQSTR